MRAALVLCLVLAATSRARADAWLDLAPMPDTTALEPAFQLDRYITHDSWCGWHRWGEHRSLGLGVSPRRDDSRATQAAGEVAYAGGTGDPGSLLAFSTELHAIGSSVRGRHELRVELADFTGHDMPRLSFGFAGVVEHGPARGLSPLWLGHGQPLTAEAHLDVSTVVTHDDAIAWLAGAEGSVGGTWWSDGPVESAGRDGLGVHLGIMPIHDDIPRGSFDIVHARLSHASLTPAVATRGTPVGPASVRMIELGTGFRDFTYHVDGDLFAVIVGDAGVVWLGTDTATAGMVSVHLGAVVKTVRGRLYDFTTRKLGIGFAHEPGFTADGRTLTSDARVTALASIENRIGSASASGGVSSVTPLAGAAPPAGRILRYGGELESYLRVGGDLEVGGHLAGSFEPRALEPWATPRTWSYEATVLLRWRDGSP